MYCLSITFQTAYHCPIRANIAIEKLAAIVSHLLSLVKGTVYPAQSSFKPPI